MTRDATDGAAGALLLHGLTGTPADLDPLASALRAAGFVVEAPLLPGHGGAPDLLAPVTRDAWREAADDALSRLRDTTGRPVAVLGASMGALLATELAAARPGDTAALVLLAPPLFLPWSDRLRLACRRVMARARPRSSWRYVMKANGVDLRDREAVASRPMMDRCPVPAVVEFVTLIHESARVLPRVACPVLVAHGDLDRTVPRAQVEALARRVTPPARTLWLPRSGHLVALDYDRDALAAAVTAFLAERSDALQPVARERI